MAPQDEPLDVGDSVEIVGMEDNEFNGIKGVIVKAVGKGRWAVKVDGNRSKVVQAVNLQKCAASEDSEEESELPAQAEMKVSIVGTWDDWEPRDMIWSKERGCFETPVTLGVSGTESFKILLNEDWDQLVHPNRKDANPHEPHEIMGPDDGGLDEEWSIGKHAADQGAEGAQYKVFFRVGADGAPKSVTWEPVASKALPSPAKPATRTESPPPAKPAWRNESPPPAKPARSYERDEDNFSNRYGNKYDDKYDDRYLNPYNDRYGRSEREDDVKQQRFEDRVQSRKAAQDLANSEREARDRLSRRLDQAAQMMVRAIQDEEDEQAPPSKVRGPAVVEERIRVFAEQEQEDVIAKIQLNKERYSDMCKENLHVKRAQFPQQTAMKPGACVECGVVTDQMAGDTMCCPACYDRYDELRKEGWNANVICDGLPAGYRAQEYAKDGSFSSVAARQYVMRRWERNFSCR